MLYRPWRVESGDKSLHVIFRDHAMSDLIGFHYQRSDPEQAAGDMIGKFLAIGRAVEANNAGRGALVPVILDGENCWEYYPDGGVRFLRALYRGCVQHPQIRPQRVRDYLKDQPATDRIGNALRRQLDLTQLRDLDRPSRRQYGLGPAAPDARVPQADRGRGQGAAGSAGQGLGRNVHRRRKRLVLVVRRRSFVVAGRTLRRAVPQASAKRLHAARHDAAECAQAPDQASAAARTAHQADAAFAR